MLDLDNFKHYNDTYGHVVGDLVLASTVQAIRSHIKQSDLVGRWGGEEFAIVLRNANTQHAVLVAERIRKTLASSPFTRKDGSTLPSPTASQGIAAIPETALDPDELIEQADRALFRAKASGRNRVVVANKE
jgi:diguanylate cyclase (GGDEF)-like protein